MRTVTGRLVSAAAKTLSQFSTIDQAPAAADVQPTTQIASSSEAVSNASVASVPIIADDNSLGLTTESLVGTWSAKTSATEAWAIRFENEGRFLMVYTSSGKNSVSRGQFSITAKRLVLSESAGTTLSGMLETDSNDRFAWKLQDKAGNSLTTLKFFKQ